MKQLLFVLLLLTSFWFGDGAFAQTSSSELQPPIQANQPIQFGSNSKESFDLFNFSWFNTSQKKEQNTQNNQDESNSEKPQENSDTNKDSSTIDKSDAKKSIPSDFENSATNTTGTGEILFEKGSYKKTSQQLSKKQKTGFSTSPQYHSVLLLVVILMIACVVILYHMANRMRNHVHRKHYRAHQYKKKNTRSSQHFRW